MISSHTFEVNILHRSGSMQTCIHPVQLPHTLPEEHSTFVGCSGSRSVLHAQRWTRRLLCGRAGMANEHVVRFLIWYVAGLLRCCLVCSCHLVHVLVISYLQHHQSTCVDVVFFMITPTASAHLPQLHDHESLRRSFQPAGKDTKGNVSALAVYVEPQLQSVSRK